MLDKMWTVKYSTLIQQHIGNKMLDLIVENIKGQILFHLLGI